MEAAFREGWRTVNAGILGVLSERDYTEARSIIDQSRNPVDKGRLPPFLTRRQRAAIAAVRQGAQPGDPLPPPRRFPFISNVTDAEVIMVGSGSGGVSRFCSLMSTSPMFVLVTGFRSSPSEKATSRSGSRKRSKPAHCTG
jgi:hypothetical protein